MLHTIDASSYYYFSTTTQKNGIYICKIQDKGMSLLFGKDGGTGKSIIFAKDTPIIFLSFACVCVVDNDVLLSTYKCGICANIAVWHCSTFHHLMHVRYCRTICIYVSASSFNYSSIYLFFLHQLIIITDKTSFYSLTDRDMDGNEVKMDKFKGDVLCVVNVASK